MKTESSKLHSAYASLWETLDSTRGSKLAKAGDDPRAKRLSDMQDALKQLHDMPSPKAAAKQEALSKVGMLKQRLESLKAMLRFASPEQAKALAHELKSIAKQLSAAAHSLGSSQGAPSPAAEAGAASEGLPSAENSAELAPAVADDATSTKDDKPEAAGDAESAEDGGGQADGEQATAASPDTSEPRSAPDDSDRSLRDSLIEARKLLKEVIGTLKAKLAAAGQEAKHDVQAAEKSLRDIDHAVAHSGGDDFYTGQGELSAGLVVGGLPASLSISGLSIDLSA